MSRLTVVSTQVTLVLLFIRYCTTFHTSNCKLRFAPRSISTGLGRNPHHEHLRASEHGCSAQMKAASPPLPPVIARRMCAFRCRAWPTCRLLASAGSRTQGRDRGWCTLVNTEKRCHPLVRLQDGSVTPQTAALPESCSEKPGFGRSSGRRESRPFAAKARVPGEAPSLPRCSTPAPFVRPVQRSLGSSFCMADNRFTKLRLCKNQETRLPV